MRFGDFSILPCLDFQMTLQCFFHFLKKDIVEKARAHIYLSSVLRLLNFSHKLIEFCVSNHKQTIGLYCSHL